MNITPPVSGRTTMNKAAIAALAVFLLGACPGSLLAQAVQRPQDSRSKSNPPGDKGPDKPASPAPGFSVPSGIHTNDVQVQLTASAAAAVIRYTLDGSEPSETSSAYSQPLRISGSTLVKAKSFAPGLAPSPTVSHTYVILDESLVGFNSNLP